ncbi:MAG: hypothetical protein V1775_14120 [Bacteroidota bacterium]
MKAKLLVICVITFMAGIFSGCNKDEKTKEISVNEAKTELRNASQTISTDMDEMMGTPAMVSLDFLTELMDNGDWKSTVKNLVFNSGKLHIAKVKSAFRKHNSDRGVSEVGDFGIYQYNFEIMDFELVENSNTQLMIAFPADEVAYNAQINNAELLLDNLVYTTITYTETYYDEYTQTWVTDTYEELVPTNANVTLEIDGISQLTLNYTASYSDSGFPTSVNATLNMAPYEFQSSLNGSGTNYNTTLSFKQNGNLMMAYDWTLNYSSDLSEVVKASGSQTVTPLKAEGWINMAVIENYMTEVEEAGGSYDLEFLNNQLDMELIHTGLNAKIGDLEFRMYTDTEYDETYPVIAVIYSDDTYEWLDTILDDGSYKFSKRR